MMRLIQKVSNPKGLVIGWLIGPVEPALRKALPGFAIVGDIEAPLNVTSADIALARKLAGVDVDCPITLVGYSAGCQSVRCALLGNLCKDALANVATFDGTHASVPPADWQLNVWRDLLAKAKAGKVGWIASCTEMTYTKTIPPGQPGRATPTREVLETVLGAPLVEGSPVIGPGKLYAEVYHSTSCDKPAHEHQGAVVMPALLGLCLGGDAWPAPAEVPAGPATSPSAVLASPDAPPGPSLGERAVTWCEAELAAGVREVPDGSNDSPRIREYFSIDFRRRETGEKLSLHSVPWCAAAQSFAHYSVAKGGEAYPAARISGAEMVADAIENGTWFPTGKRGDLAIFVRGNVAGWERHVARVLSVDPLVTIAGNESNTWKVTEHGNDPPDLLGFIKVG